MKKVWSLLSAVFVTLISIVRSSRNSPWCTLSSMSTAAWSERTPRKRARLITAHPASGPVLSE